MELNEIYNIDCLTGMKLIPDKSIDMIFVDLPYQKTHNSWDVMIPFEPMWEQFERIIKDNGAILLFGQDKFTAKLMLSNEKLHRYNIVWDKVLPSGFLNAKRQPLRSHEDICVFYKKPCTYNPQMVKGEKCHTRGKAVGKSSEDTSSQLNYSQYNIVETEGNMKYPKSIWTFPKPHPSIAIHPTQKPVALCRYAIRTYTNEGDTVLDCCCGSGSIPLAAYLESRNYIGMDNGVCGKKNSEYYGRPWAEIATERIKKCCDNINICHDNKCKGCEKFGWVYDHEKKVHGYFTCRLQNKKCADTHVTAEFITPQHFSESGIVLYDD